MAAVRRHLIIEPKFQVAFTLAFVRGLVLSIAIPAAFTFLAVQIFAKTATLTDAERLAITSASQSLALVMVLASGALGAISAVVGLLLSHRYAGPLKRIESWAARHLLGEPVEPLILRPGDELSSVASTLARIMKQENRP
jgi:hypothetical protein